MAKLLNYYIVIIAFLGKLGKSGIGNNELGIKNMRELVFLTSFLCFEDTIILFACLLGKYWKLFTK